MTCLVATEVYAKSALAMSKSPRELLSLFLTTLWMYEPFFAVSFVQVVADKGVIPGKKRSRTPERVSSSREVYCWYVTWPYFCFTTSLNFTSPLSYACTTRCGCGQGWHSSARRGTCSAEEKAQYRRWCLTYSEAKASLLSQAIQHPHASISGDHA